MQNGTYISNESVLQLWSGLRLGDEVCYTSLMRIFIKPMYRYGIRFINDPHFVQDCIQDVFFELWSRREKIRQAECVKSYLYKALRMRIFREKSKWKQALPIEDNYEFMMEFDAESSMIKQEISQEVYRKLQKILDKLPKRQKEILYLRFYEGMSQETIAGLMDLNKQSVYNLMHESILSLRKYWAKSPVYYCL